MRKNRNGSLKPRGILLTLASYSIAASTHPVATSTSKSRKFQDLVLIISKVKPPSESDINFFSPAFTPPSWNPNEKESIMDAI